jgi:sulfite exporter TauE/SafE
LGGVVRRLCFFHCRDTGITTQIVTTTISDNIITCNLVSWGLSMIAPKAEDIGRTVVYYAIGAIKGEIGVITSMNKDFVFVRFQGDHGSKATLRRDLEWRKEK